MLQNQIKLTVKKDLFTDQINVTQVYGDVDIGISGGYSYVELPEWLRAQVAALDLLPAMERVEGLGYRIGQDFYLVEYNKDCEASSR